MLNLLELEPRLVPRASPLNHLGFYNGPPPAPGTLGANLYNFFHPPRPTQPPAAPPPPAPTPTPTLEPPPFNPDRLLNDLWLEMPPEWHRVVDAVGGRYVVIDEDLTTYPVTAPYAAPDTTDAIGVDAVGLVIYEPNSGHYTMYLERAIMTNPRVTTELFAHEAGHLYSQNLRLAQPPHPALAAGTGTPMASQTPQFVALAGRYGVDSADAKALEEVYAMWLAAVADPEQFVLGDDINAYFLGVFGAADYLVA